MKLLFLLAVAILHTSGTLANPCVSDCGVGHLGNYQSCNGCNVYVSCVFGYTIDNRPCPGSLVWDDNKKRCDWTSATCPPKTTTTTTTTTAPGCSTKFAVTVDARMYEFYIDGKGIPGSLEEYAKNHWRTLGQGCVPDGSRVVAIRAWRDGNDGGVLFSTSAGFFTDGNEAWRCTDAQEPGWMEPDFDDSHWDVARVHGEMGVHGRDKIFDEMNRNAKWIWSAPGAGRFAHCRGRLPQPKCTNTFGVTVDNVLHELYVDGVSMPSVIVHETAPHWPEVEHGCLPKDASVIAIKATDKEDGIGSWPGILLYTATGFITDDSGAWRCTTQEEAGWMNADFDDSHWNVARVTGGLGDPPRQIPIRDADNTGAKWIWAEPTGGAAYCRGHLRP